MCDHWHCCDLFNCEWPSWRSDNDLLPERFESLARPISSALRHCVLKKIHAITLWVMLAKASIAPSYTLQKQNSITLRAEIL